MKTRVFSFGMFILVGAAILISCGSEVFGADEKLTKMKAQLVQRPHKSYAGRKLRIIVIGAHPDDCEIRAGGAAAMWSGQGHLVKFVSMTNGDMGHWKTGGGALAKIRMAETQKTAKILGVTSEVLDNHDGELMPTLENRKKVVKLIREWKADVVITHRANDYHPDHRYTGILVQDSAIMVMVPFFSPDVDALSENPVYMYVADRFKKPNPFEPDVVVDISGVFEKKLEACLAFESQFLEGGGGGHEGLIPKTAAEKKQRQKEVSDYFTQRLGLVADNYREELVEMYGKDKGGKIKFAEAFEVCEYGYQPTEDELKLLFPFF